MAMRTLEVSREFYEISVRLAEETKIPEVKAKLLRLAEDYLKKLDELECVKRVACAEVAIKLLLVVEAKEGHVFVAS